MVLRHSSAIQRSLILRKRLPYNEDDTVNVMMMAWGGICAEDMVALNLEAEPKR